MTGKTKRCIALVLSLLFLLALLPSGASASTVASGTCGAQGSDLTWTLDSDGVLTISGTGEMADYKNSNKSRAPWYEYRASIFRIVIREGVTRIGAYAFHYCSSLTSVNIPDRVTQIGGAAFYGCSALTSITLPNGVTQISACTFDCCSSLTSVTIPDGVTQIGGSAFHGCSSLTSVAIPDSVTQIDSAVFSGCTSLTSAAIPNGVTQISNYAFHGCSDLTSVTIPEGVTQIGTQAFCGCSSLTSVTIPDGVTQIGSDVFRGCSSLTSVSIPNSVTQIGSYAFSGCSGLTNVSIPNSVTVIEDCTFSGCSGLTRVTIPNSVTKISYRAFYGCSGLMSVTIPNSVTQIGGSAFQDCSGLTSVTIPEGVTSIGYQAFYGCSGLTSATISNSVSTIAYMTFCRCSRLMSVIIPNSVTRIGSSAFEYCSSLTSITIPDSVTKIDISAFENCSSLQDVYYSGSASSWGEIEILSSNDCLLNASIHFNSGSSAGTASITFDHGDSYRIDGGVKFSLTATIANADDFDEDGIIWSSSDPGIARIERSYFMRGRPGRSMAVIKGISTGTATITIRTPDGKMRSCTVTVQGDAYVPVTHVSLILIDPVLRLGQTRKIEAVVSPLSATDTHLTWSSSDSSIVSVDCNGNITAHKPGVGIISANSADGYSGVITVEVQRDQSYRLWEYDFKNVSTSFGYEEGYKISFLRYMQAGYSLLESSIYCRRTWDGSCFGMGTSSIMFYSDLLEEENFDPRIHFPIYFENPDSNSAKDTKLREMIELYQAAQFRCNHRYFRNEKSNRNAVDRIKQELDSGNPVSLGIYGMCETESGTETPLHLVVIYSYQYTDEDSVYFHIYDSSGFVSGLEFTIQDSWEFAYNDAKYTWTPEYYVLVEDLIKWNDLINTGHDLDHMSVSGYNLGRNAWSTVRGDSSLTETESDLNDCLLLVDAVDFTIRNSENSVAVITGGQAEGEIEGINIELPGYLSEDPHYIVNLPVDTYTFTGLNGLVMADDTMSINVAGDADSITVSEDLHEITLTAESSDFSVVYTTYNNVYDTLTLSGSFEGSATISLSADLLETAVTGASSLCVSAAVSDSPVSAEADGLNGNEVSACLIEDGSAVSLQLTVDGTALDDAVPLAGREQTGIPDYDLESGEYTEGQRLSFSTDGETLVYYTTDGSEPTSETGRLYTGAIIVDHSMTVKAIATKYGYSDSEAVTLTYTLPEVAPPAASHESGSYEEVLYIRLYPGRQRPGISRPRLRRFDRTHGGYGPPCADGEERLRERNGRI